jgi:competence protein ComEA
MPNKPDDSPPPGIREDSPDSPATRAAAIDVTAGASSAQLPDTDDQRATALKELREAALRAAGVLSHPSIPPEQLPRFWLRRGDQVLLAALLTLATGLLFVHWVRISDWGRSPIEIDRLPPGEYLYRIDINQATWVEWAQLEGIGETLARRIIADRQERGPFSSVDDLLRVRGIGRAKLDGMRPHLKSSAAHEP